LLANVDRGAPQAVITDTGEEMRFFTPEARRGKGTGSPAARPPQEGEAASSSAAREQQGLDPAFQQSWDAISEQFERFPGGERQINEVNAYKEKAGLCARRATAAPKALPSSEAPLLVALNAHEHRMLKFYTDQEMLPAYVAAFIGILKSFDSMQYILDNEELCKILCQKVSQMSVRGRLIIDRDNLSASGAKGRECPRINELKDAGIEIRVFKPRYKGFGFASLHCKTWIIDDSLVLSGSVNVTDCGFGGNKEHMYEIRDPEVVAALRADFTNVWNEAEPLCDEKLAKLTEEYNQRMLDKEKEKKEKEEQRSRRSQSLPTRRALGDAEAPPLEATQE